MAGIALKLLEVAGHGWEWLEWLEMAGMAGLAGNGWKWLEILEMAEHFLKYLKMANNG